MKYEVHDEVCYSVQCVRAGEAYGLSQSHAACTRVFRWHPEKR
jgi:hypothetical protein